MSLASRYVADNNMWIPRFCTTEKFPILGWRISHSELTIASFIGVEEDKKPRDMKFASKKDCEMACMSLNKSGVTLEDYLHGLDRMEFRRIACENLSW